VGEAVKEQYWAKSSLFYQTHSTFLKVMKLLDDVDWDALPSRELSEIGISQKAVDTLKANGIPLERVFSHPSAIYKEPKLILYYRSVAGISQKGIRIFAFGTEKYESGREITMPRAVELSKALNTFITALVESDSSFSLEGAKTTAAMTFGAQIDGTWRNVVGVGGADRVKQILMGFLRDKGVIESFGLRIKGKERKVGPTENPRVQDVVRINLTNGYYLKFGSDPDISLIDDKGGLVAVVEVKGGLDPAGALERYGAAKKSFSHARDRNKAVDTIYIGLLTTTVLTDMAHDQLVTKEYQVTEVFSNLPAREDFLKRILWLAHL
jgi:hypothetical protein